MTPFTMNQAVLNLAVLACSATTAIVSIGFYRSYDALRKLLRDLEDRIYELEVAATTKEVEP